MKKIFAILISLIFVASTFGVASVMSGTACECQITGPSTVKVGDVFVVELRYIGSPCFGSIKPAQSLTYLEIVETESLPYGEKTKYRAIRPGIEKEIFCCGPTKESMVCHDVIVLPRALPMDWIMKKFGLGKFKE